jgi:hypothetical protein
MKIEGKKEKKRNQERRRKKPKECNRNMRSSPELNK